VQSNPTGILYNPFSISQALYRIVSGKPYQESDLFEQQGRWHSFDHHSRFSNTSPQQALTMINNNLFVAHNNLRKTDFCILTPGTSFTFTEKHSQRIVANCHKLPQQTFDRKCESSQNIYTDWKNLINKISSLFPKMRFILTISPVRHYPSQPRDNQLSKANLVSALYALENEFSNVYYFPSFEIMMDELRDYRFYDADMAHPNDTAINYIWERFLDACVSERSQKFTQKFYPIFQARNHLFSDDLPNEQQITFARSILDKINHLIIEYPEINLSDDLLHFRKMSSDESFSIS
jgi:hypothetical protein